MPELSDSELKWGYWWLTHRELLHRLVAVTLLLVGVGLCSFSLWQLGDWLSSRAAEEQALRQLVSSSLNVEEYRRSSSPLPIEVGTVTAVPAGRGLYDLVAQVKNPNLKWAVTELPFTFTTGGQTASGTSFLLPLEEKYLVKLGLPLTALPKSSQLTLGATRWQRIRDVSTLATPSFEATAQSIEEVVSLSGEGGGTRLTFNLTNTSPYSFWQVGVTVVLSQRGSVQAVGQQFVSDLGSQGTRGMEFYWPDQVVTADNVVVKPEVNVLDPRAFK